MQVPTRCGAEANSPFIAQYRRAFESVKPRLRAGNIEAFYGSLCTAWQQAAQAARVRADQVEEARAAVLLSNQAAQDQAQVKRIQARALSKLALTFVAGCLGFFMTTALFLAFLTLEKHSRSMGRAVELLSGHLRQEAPDAASSADSK